MEEQVQASTREVQLGSPSERVAVVAGKFEVYRKQYEAERDRRAVCLLAFNMMYQELAWKLHDNDFDFDDPEWVGDLATEFADLLFSAFDGIDMAVEANPENPDFGDIARPWVDVFKAINDPRSSVLEDLLCGLVAHIGHDLPLALSMVGLESNGTSRVRDFHRLNDVLGSLTEVVQKAVTRRFNPFLNILDKLAGGTDEFVTNITMQVSRAVAWYTAARLLDPLSAADARGSMESVVEHTVEHLRRPKGLRHRMMMWTARLFLRGKRRWPRLRAFVDRQRKQRAE